MERTTAVAQNLTKVLLCKTQKLEEHQTNFIKRFYIRNHQVYYERPVPFGVVSVHPDEMTVKEFNKLHRIANPSSRSY